MIVEISIYPKVFFKTVGPFLKDLRRSNMDFEGMVIFMGSYYMHAETAFSLIRSKNKHNHKSRWNLAIGPRQLLKIASMIFMWSMASTSQGSLIDSTSASIRGLKIPWAFLKLGRDSFPSSEPLPCLSNWNVERIYISLFGSWLEFRRKEMYISIRLWRLRQTSYWTNIIKILWDYSLAGSIFWGWKLLLFPFVAKFVQPLLWTTIWLYELSFALNRTPFFMGVKPELCVHEQERSLPLLTLKLGKACFIVDTVLF